VSTVTRRAASDQTDKGWPVPDEPQRSPAGGVQSVHRALDVLEALAGRGGTATLAQVAQDAAVPLPTAHRLLGTLLDRGYVRRLGDRRYALGFRFTPLATAAGSAVGAGSEAGLRRLVDALGETANLAVLDSDQMVYVAQVPGRHAMRMFTEVGRRVDPHCTAVGKAVLALLPEAEVRALLGRTGLAPRTEHTVRDADALVELLDRVRETGYAVDEEEQEVGVRCVAVAVPGARTPLAVSVSGPAPRMTDDLLRQAVPLLHEVAADLARALG